MDLIKGQFKGNHHFQEVLIQLILSILMESWRLSQLKRLQQPLRHMVVMNMPLPLLIVCHHL